MRVLSEWESKSALGAGLPRPREELTSSAAQAVSFAESLGPGRAVLKASGPAHKTEIGAVRRGLDPVGVAAAWHEVASLGDGKVLVAEQVDAELELILGGVRDEQFGPVLSVGLGGVGAEVLDDAVWLLAPLRDDELKPALAELRGAALLEGHRGSSPVDLAGLAAILRSIGDLMLRDEDVEEVDCNPVLVRGGRPLVADALVVKRA